MNKIILISLLAFAYSACRQKTDYDIAPTPTPPTPFDLCDVNRVACSFEFRKGKWVEHPLPWNIQYPADTIEFYTDSLIRISREGQPYYTCLGYFMGTGLALDLDTNGQVTVFGSRYADSTQIFTIGWNAGLSETGYSRVN